MRDIWEAIKAVAWFGAQAAELLLIVILFLWMLYGVLVLIHFLTHLSTAGI